MELYGGATNEQYIDNLLKQTYSTLRPILINEKFQFSSLKNLYIVGSSAFPSSGFENPTHGAMATSLIATEDIIEKINNKIHNASK